MVLCGMSRAALVVFISVVIAEVLASSQTNLLRRARTLASLSMRMQPEVAAHAFVQLEDEWRLQAAPFLVCNSSTSDIDGGNSSTSDVTGGFNGDDFELQNGSDSEQMLMLQTKQRDAAVNCTSVPEAFEKSFTVVVQSILQGSSGDAEEAHEYLNDVCNQKTLSQGWRHNSCQGLSQTIFDAMSQDDFGNRESVDIHALAAGFWLKFLEEDRKITHPFLSKEDKAALLSKAHLEEDEMISAKSEIDEAMAQTAADDELEEKQEKKKQLAALSTTKAKIKAKGGSKKKKMALAGKIKSTIHSRLPKQKQKPWPDPWTDESQKIFDSLARSGLVYK